jgi:hypothetical protein
MLIKWINEKCSGTMLPRFGFNLRGEASGGTSGGTPVDA